MSLEVLLIPAGIAIYHLVREHRRTDLCEGCRQTRITELSLLHRALAKLGATDIRSEHNVVTAQLGPDSLRFQQIEGVILGRVDGGSEQATDEFVERVDRVAGGVVQADKVEEMRTRAAQLGLRLVGEELDEDGTVQLVFEEVS